MKLENISWEEFEIGKLFSIENCKCSNISLLKGGNTPYVGATNRNNGVLKYINPIEKLITAGNCLAFICDGEGSVGCNIYKKEDFIGSTTVKVGRNRNLNVYNATFITTIADTVRSKYNFGFKRNEFHLKKEKILLPANSKKEPDYAFMEQFMRAKEREKLEEYSKFAHKKLDKLKDYKEVKPLNEKEWSEFFIDDIFIIKPGKRLTKAEMKKGDTPFIGASDSNNGITNFISNTNVSIDKNILGVNYNGSVVENFYHPYKAIFSDDVKRLSFKNTDGNEFLYLFVKTIILKQKSKFQYAYKFNETRMIRQKILLPINSKNEPDYEYMENYIKKIEFDKLSQYLKYKKY